MGDVIIIGAGIAGCKAAENLTRLGHKVHLVEKESYIGGHLNDWYQLFPDRKQAKVLLENIKTSIDNKNISLYTDVQPTKIEEDTKAHKYIVTLSNMSVVEGDAILIATGFKTFDASRKEEYGYGIYDNVITSVELENMFMNPGSINKSNKSIGLIFCVGSRDEKVCNFHCSKVCCVTAVKQAIEVRELCPDADIFCFYMDMRMFGIGYEEMYRTAQEKYNIKFVRGRLSEATETMDKRLAIKVEDTLIGKPLRLTLDLMVLMVGMEASNGTNEMMKLLNIPPSVHGFIGTTDPHTGTNTTTKQGVFVTGTASTPMNITDVINDAAAAAITISNYINSL